MPRLSVEAEPANLAVDTETAALIIIDMQRDFLEPGGFGAALGNDVSLLRAAVAPCRDMLGLVAKLEGDGGIGHAAIFRTTFPSVWPCST